MSEHSLWGYDDMQTAMQLRAAMLDGLIPPAATGLPVPPQVHLRRQQEPEIPDHLLAASRSARAISRATGTAQRKDPPGEHVDSVPQSEIRAAVRSSRARYPRPVRRLPASSTRTNVARAAGAVASGAMATERDDSTTAAAASSRSDRKHRLSLDREAIGPPVAKKPRVPPPSRSWEDMYQALLYFMALRGHAHVPFDHPEDPELASWVREQRLKRPYLTPEQRYKLSLVGFAWENIPTHNIRAPAGAPAIVASEAMVTALAKKNTSLILKHRLQQQQLQLKGRQQEPPHLPSYHRRKIEQEESDEQYWNRMYKRLQQFRETHGHCQIPVTDDPLFGIWVLQQRELFREGELSADRQAKLDSIGLLQTPLANLKDDRDGGSNTGKAKSDSKRQQKKSKGSKEPKSKRVRSFEENFQALLRYKNEHGNCDVPQKYSPDRKLGIWVKNIRQHPHRTTKEQQARLDSISFKWRKLQLDSQWNKACQQLLNYKKEHGDCNVPSRWDKDPSLARWVHTQRTMFRRNKLLEDRKKKLEDIGFIWDWNAVKEDEAFQDNYDRLIAFKKKYGHPNVTSKFRKEKTLGKWADRMRELYNNGDLDAERMKALEDIGFVFSNPAASPEEKESTSSSSSSSSSESSHTSHSDSDTESDESDEYDTI